MATTSEPRWAKPIDFTKPLADVAEATYADMLAEIKATREQLLLMTYIMARRNGGELRIREIELDATRPRDIALVSCHDAASREYVIRIVAPT